MKKKKTLKKVFLCLTLPFWFFPYMIWVSVGDMMDEWERENERKSWATKRQK